MRKLGILVSLLFILSLTGCAAEYNLSVGDTNLVAESVAGLLLKYDYNYREQALLLPKTEAPSTTLPDTSSEEVANDDKLTDITYEGKSSEVGQLSISEPVIEESTLSEVIGDNNFDIQFIEHGIYPTYPADADNSYFSLTPSKGRQLLVITFSTKNLTDESQTLNLMDSKVRFKLSINDSKNVNPLYTVLDNSLMFINLEIGPGKEEEVILVFEINPDEVDSSIFTASRNDLLYKVELK